MSRFIDKLKVASGEETQPMGFGLGKSTREKPRMQLVASPASLDLERLSALSDADAGIVQVSSSADVKILEKLCQNGSIPWGRWLRKTGAESNAKLTKAGCDFIVFSPADTPAMMPKEEKLGKILEVDPALSESLLRTIEDLPVDAVLAAGGKEDSFTWWDLMHFRRLVGLAGKPLLVQVSSRVTADELQSLWDMGVTGLVVKLENEPAWERLSALRQEVDKVTYCESRKRAKRTVLLPRISAETPEPVEDEGDEE